MQLLSLPNLLALGLLSSTPIVAQTITSTSLGSASGAGGTTLPALIRIADTTTPVPGGSGTFALFHDARAIDGGRVVFLANDAASHTGVYAWHGQALRALADRSTVVPGTSDHFSSFFDVAIDGTRVCFSGLWPGPSNGCAFGGSEGLFEVDFAGGTPLMLADSLSTAQNCFHGVDNNLGRTLVGSGIQPVDLIHNHTESIFRAEGTGLVTLVDLATPRPGGGSFSGFDQDFVLQGNPYAFADILLNTFGAVAGLYADFGAGLVLVADASTPVPGGSGTFTNFAGYDFDGNEMAFMGRSTGAAGLYAGSSPTNLRVLVDNSTPVPGESVNFLGVSNPVGSGPAGVFFSGYWNGGGQGLFVTRGGSVRTIVKKGQVVDGRVVDQAFCRTQHVGGSSALVELRFVNGARGLYLARP